MRTGGKGLLLQKKNIPSFVRYQKRIHCVCETLVDSTGVVFMVSVVFF